MATDIFTPRGISNEVRDARGYAEYRAGHPEDVIAVAPGLAQHPKWLQKFTQVDGWVMPKHPLNGSRIRPQLRPDVPVEEDPWEHRHSEMEDWERKTHLASPKRAPEHVGVGPSKLHVHPQRAKYALAPKSYREHWGYKWPYDDSVRLDHNPITDFYQPGRVFFGIEGCLKNDSIASRGEKVFNVPGVSMWNAPELMQVALRHLLCRQPGASDYGDGPWPVFIVPDSDWAKKTEVIFHATNCREYLSSLGVAAYIAAPPPIEELGAPEDDKGVDDYLGKYGGTLDDLRVLQRDVDEASFAEWEDEYRRSARGRDGKRGWGTAAVGLDIKVAHAIALSSRAGESMRSVAAITGAIFRPREISNLAASKRAYPIPTCPELGRDFPELSRFRGVHAWEEREHAVYKSLKRLEERGAYELTGIFPDWRKALWGWGKGGKRRRYGAGPEDPFDEIVRLDPRLRVAEGKTIPVHKVCALLGV